MLKKKYTIAGSMLLLPFLLNACITDNGQFTRISSPKAESNAPIAIRISDDIPASPDQSTCVLAPISNPAEKLVPLMQKGAHEASLVKWNEVIEVSKNEAISKRNALGKLIRDYAASFDIGLSGEALKGFVDNLLARTPRVSVSSESAAPGSGDDTKVKISTTLNIPESVVAFVTHQEALKLSFLAPIGLSTVDARRKFADEFLKYADPAQSLIAYGRALQFAKDKIKGMDANDSSAVAFASKVSKSPQPLSALLVYMETYTLDRIEGLSDDKAQADASAKACLK